MKQALYGTSLNHYKKNRTVFHLSFDKLTNINKPSTASRLASKAQKTDFGLKYHC